MMPRPLYDSFKIRMPSQLGEIAQPAKRLVDALEGVKLHQLESIKYKTHVSEAYNFLKDKLGPVCGTKALHVLGQEIVVPWDNEIREHYGLNIYDQDYFKFLEICRKELSDVLMEARIQSGDLPGMFYQGDWKPNTKLIDEYHQAVIRKLPPHFSQ